MGNTMREAFEQVPLETRVASDLTRFGGFVVTIEPLQSEFVATASKTLANGRTIRSAQALGNTREDAANQLVRTFTRP